MINFRPVLHISGYFLLILAVAMGVPAIVDVMAQPLDWPAFVAAAMITGFAGLSLILGARPPGKIELPPREAFLLTVATWVLTAAFGAIPFILASLDLSYTDAFFETMSGLTTTGSTVITGLDRMSPAVLLWRALLQWLGGIGIIVMGVAILPLLRIGGMQLFRMESSDKMEKVMPRVSQIAWAIFVLYMLFTALCALALRLAGMSWFEAVCHAFTTLSTGGFSTSDASLGHFASPAIEWIVTLFMTIGGATFVLFITPWHRQRWALLHDQQMRWYVAFLGFFSLAIGSWHWLANAVPPHEAYRHAAFSVVSVVTTTGFAAADYSQWGGFAQVTFFVLTFIGGCTGSTAGGIKIFRFQVLFALGGVQIKRLLHPHGIFVIDFNRQNIADAVTRSVLGFMVIYFASFAVTALLLAVIGLDTITSLSGSATALGNVGPGLGAVIGPAGNFQPLPDSAKWLLSFQMLLGRLELFTVLVLLAPAFWRD